MSEKLQLNILTPAKTICTDQAVDTVTMPGADGELGILPGHATLLTLLGSGKVTYLQGTQSHSFEISGGFAEVAGDRLILLLEKVEPV